MAAKKGLLSRLFRTKDESDCCEVTIVADDEPATAEALPDTADSADAEGSTVQDG